MKKNIVFPNLPSNPWIPPPVLLLQASFQADFCLLNEVKLSRPLPSHPHYRPKPYIQFQGSNFGGWLWAHSQKILYKQTCRRTSVNIRLYCTFSSLTIATIRGSHQRKKTLIQPAGHLACAAVIYIYGDVSSWNQTIKFLFVHVQPDSSEFNKLYQVVSSNYFHDLCLFDSFVMLSFLSHK